MRKFTLKWRPHSPNSTNPGEQCKGGGGGGAGRGRDPEGCGSTFGKRSGAAPDKPLCSSQWAGKALAFPVTSARFSPSDQTNACFKQLLGKPGNGLSPSPGWVPPVPVHNPTAAPATQIWEVLFPAISPWIWTQVLGLRDRVWEYMYLQPPARRLAWRRSAVSNGNAAPRGISVRVWKHQHLPRGQIVILPCFRS